MGTITSNIDFWKWTLVIGFSVLLFIFSPTAKNDDDFYRAQRKGKAPGFFLLTGSLVISWVFAKSITNASDLGFNYGWLGGLAYASYYLSFIVAGIVIFRMRTRGGFQSIHEFLRSRFGRKAIVLFSFIIVFRLFNEIWSNTMVIGGYFGENGSLPYYSSILVFTALTLAYTLKGGLRSSFFTDAIQLVLFGGLLSLLLALFYGTDQLSFSQVGRSSHFDWSDGLNLLLVGILQSFSYPFHDPVMTDRGFVSNPKTTLRSFITAGIVGGALIFLFSCLGIYGKLLGMEDGRIQVISQTLGPIALLAVNFIMIISAASTLDSTFSSVSKLAVFDLNLGKGISFGRKIMIGATILGTIPIFFNPAILSATTVSGTMVIGLTPVFLFWKLPAPSISFYLSVSAGMFIGIIYALGFFPKQLIFTEGPYNDLLAVNIFGVVLCVLSYVIPMFVSQFKPSTNE